MTRLTNAQLVSKANQLLESGLSVAQVAKKLGFKTDNALYQKMYRLGCKVNNYRQFVPIHAPELTDKPDKAA